MKKTFLIFGLVLTIVFAFATRVSAIDLNLVNSIRQNEIDETQNWTGISTSTNTNANVATSETSNYLSSSTLTPSNTGSVTVGTVTPTSSQSQGLTTSDIIDIVLIVVGILIVLLGIAILIRMNHG